MTEPKSPSTLETIMQQSPIDRRALACSITMENRLKAMSDAQVVKEMPQLLEHGPNGVRYSPKVDFGGAKGVDNTDIRAALALAYEVARDKHIKVSDVDLDDLDRKKGCAIVDQLAGRKPSPQTCATPPKSSGRER